MQLANLLNEIQRGWLLVIMRALSMLCYVPMLDVRNPLLEGKGASPLTEYVNSSTFQLTLAVSLGACIPTFIELCIGGVTETQAV